MREIKFRQPIFDSKGYFKEYHYWGFLVDGFEGPASYLNAKQNIDFKLIQEQYTGLKDKNGKEIYESDVVYSGLYGYGKVVWDEKEASFYLKFNPEEVVISHLKECNLNGNLHEK